MLRYTTLCFDSLCYSALYHVVYVVLCVTLFYAMFVMLRFVVFNYSVLCFVLLSYFTRHNNTLRFVL